MSNAPEAKSKKIKDLDIALGGKVFTIVYYNTEKNKLDFLCDDAGQIQWVGPLCRVYEKVASILIGSPALQVESSKFYALDNETYHRCILGFNRVARGGAYGVYNTDAHIFSLMKRVAFENRESYMAFPSTDAFRDILLKSEFNKHGGSLPPSALLAVQHFLDAQTFVDCTSCGCACFVPQNLDRAIDNADQLDCNYKGAFIQNIMGREHTMCMICAGVIVSSLAELMNHVHGLGIAPMIAACKKAVLSGDISKITPLLGQMVKSIGGVGITTAVNTLSGAADGKLKGVSLGAPVIHVPSNKNKEALLLHNKEAEACLPSINDATAEAKAASKIKLPDKCTPPSDAKPWLN